MSDKNTPLKYLAWAACWGLVVMGLVYGQAHRRSASDTGSVQMMLPVILEAPPGDAEPPAFTREKFELYDAGVAQQIEYLRPDYSPAKIVILVDNTETLRAVPAEMTKAVTALTANLYQGDQVMLIAYDRHPEVLEEFTDNRAKVDKATRLFRKQGTPRLLDAIQATINDALRVQIGASKRVIVLISDGYDLESTTPVKAVLTDLQRENILVYILQIQDRTLGAPRRKALKPEEMVERLTKGTGGRVFPLKEAETAAREIMREVSERWYQLSYKPQGVNRFNTRRLLITVNDPKIRLRTKLEQPGEQP